MADKRFMVHVYRISEQSKKLFARPKKDTRELMQVYEMTEYFFHSLADAKKFADLCFNETGCYKIKVWDPSKGPVFGNITKSAALVYELPGQKQAPKD